MQTINPFRSFWMAGYECSDQLNCFGHRVDLLSITGHLQKVHEDYRALSAFGITTVREGIRWSRVERTPYQYDWSDVRRMVDAAAANHIQQVWDLCHFGFPDDLTPLHPQFARRFAAMCRAFVRFFRSIRPSDELIVTPINEMSFLSWLGGDVCGTAPYCSGQGWAVKYALVKACIGAIVAMKEEDETLRILTTEPLVNMVPPLGADERMLALAKERHLLQFQVLDMLCGSICPELGGRPEFLDMIGCNFYFNNQWIVDSNEFLPWLNEEGDPRWRSLSALMQEVFERYQRPLVLSETSHPGEHRGSWIGYVTDECCRLLEREIPLWGVCWYPAIDRPDWDHPSDWHHAGIWDVDPTTAALTRTLHQPTATALRQAMKLIKLQTLQETAE
jgi:hypothetical protein